jgi:arabinose-5-phosphate isomerase
MQRRIYHSNGRLVVTGIGKSAIIAQKMVATFNSTGTPSLFLHASEAIHGDLGMVQKDDIIICISKAETVLKKVCPLLKFWQYANRYNRKHDFVSCKRI